jgi:hypothetical protein
MRHRKDGSIEAVVDREHIMRSRLRCEVRRQTVMVLAAGLKDRDADRAAAFGPPEQSDELARVNKAIDAWIRALPKKDET